MSVRLRPMRWWDVAPALPLEAELFGAEAWTAETWWAELAQPGRHYLVAEDADNTERSALVGYGGVLVNGSDADIMTVAVARVTIAGDRRVTPSVGVTAADQIAASAPAVAMPPAPGTSAACSRRSLKPPSAVTSAAGKAPPSVMAR